VTFCKVRNRWLDTGALEQPLPKPLLSRLLRQRLSAQKYRLEFCRRPQHFACSTNWPPPAARAQPEASASRIWNSVHAPDQSLAAGLSHVTRLLASLAQGNHGPAARPARPAGAVHHADHFHPGHDHGAARRLHARRAIDVGYVVVDLDGSAHSKALVKRLNKTAAVPPQN
jgi:hypothetical protein